jgi:hypothetical protein
MRGVKSEAYYLPQSLSESAPRRKRAENPFLGDYGQQSLHIDNPIFTKWGFHNRQ